MTKTMIASTTPTKIDTAIISTIDSSASLSPSISGGTVVFSAVILLLATVGPVTNLYKHTHTHTHTDIPISKMTILFKLVDNVKIREKKI